MMRQSFHKLRTLLWSSQAGSAGHHAEKLISGAGALVAIFFIGAINVLAIPDMGAGMPLIIASMGASAILVFATPHSPFTQPWPVLGGQLVSALVGVTCALYIPDLHVAAALSVALSLVAMYYLRCLHPPGGATALNAVIGGAPVHELSYQYVTVPVMLDSLALVFVAIVFNSFFLWRRYPLNVMPTRKNAVEAEASPPPYLSEEDIRYAREHMGSFVDVSEQELAQIFEIAVQHAESTRMRAQDIRLGRYYSNGAPGNEWSVREVIDESGQSVPERDKIIYRVAAGAQLRTTGICARADFARWARYEVVQDGGVWKRCPANSGTVEPKA